MCLAKMFGAGILIIAYSIISFIGTRMFVKKLPLRKFLIKTTSFFSNLLLAVLDITVAPVHSPLWQSDEPYLIVSNHLSYLDILVIASAMPSVFVSSMEVRADAFLGFLAGCGGTLFIERRNKANLKYEIGAITDILKKGLSVVLFPEGTSSNGESVLPFKKSLIETAFLSQCNVLPVCIQYCSENEKLPGSRKDSVYWYGDMAFFPHFFNLFKQTNLHVTLQIMEPLAINEYASRAELSYDAYHAISTAYNLKMPETLMNDFTKPPMNLSYEH